IRDHDQLPPTRHGGHPTGAALELGRGRSADELCARKIVAVETVEKREPIPEQARREEVPAHVLLAAERHLARTRRVIEDLLERPRALLDGVDEEPGVAVLDLVDN